MKQNFLGKLNENQRKLNVWKKGKPIIGKLPMIWISDDCGATIKWEEYGNRDSKFGWEIDHIDPNGPDTINNLRPLQWFNNTSKSDGRLTCPIRN